MSQQTLLKVTFYSSSNKHCTHIHGAVDLGDGLVVSGELVDLHAVAHQLAHDLNLKLVQLALRDGVGLRDDGDYVHL